MVRGAIFVATILLVCQPAFASGRCDNHHFIEIRVLSNGTMRWNGAPIDKRGLIKNFKALAAMKNRPSIKLVPDRLTSYDNVVYILTLAQKVGSDCFGFTGIDR